MEKRRFKRKLVSLDAEFTSASKSYAGAIANLSEEGVGLYTETAPKNTSMDFIPGTILELKFQLPSGEKLNLQCEIKWLHIHKTPSQDLMNSMGMEIIDIPQKYKEFFKTL